MSISSPEKPYFLYGRHLNVRHSYVFVIASTIDLPSSGSENGAMARYRLSNLDRSASSSFSKLASCIA